MFTCLLFTLMMHYFLIRNLKKNVKTYTCIVFRNPANDGNIITQERLPDKKIHHKILRRLKKIWIYKKKRVWRCLILQVARLVSVTKLTRYSSDTLTPRREGSLILYSNSTAKRWWGNSIHKGLKSEKKLQTTITY